VGISALVALNWKGYAYYLTPVQSRPFLSNYQEMKPSGIYSHGLGILGTLMIITGVVAYSTRKRMKSLWKLGKISHWLEFHIFLCLLGPIFIIYHTTFKASGIAAISLWTMTAVAISGILGRFLYTFIPRNLNGNELSMEELNSKLQELNGQLASSPSGNEAVQLIDSAFSAVRKPKNLSEAFASYFRLRRLSSKIRRQLRHLFSENRLPHDTVEQLISIASLRVSLLRQSYILHYVGKAFYYWHVIHLPFSIIMFLTLAAHITAAILLGYRWVW